jgi:hypothetical protein
MALPRLTYNSKTIDFTALPYRLNVSPTVPRTVNRSITGVSEIIALPRVDIDVTMSFRIIDSILLRYQFDNWWQWAQRGSAWTFAADSAKVVDTTTTANAAAGATSVAVTSATGITIGQTYKLMTGPYYQLVTVTNVVSLTITVNSLDTAFVSGAVFRDQYYFRGLIPDASPTPINIVDADMGQPWPPTRFELELAFRESLT